MKPIPYLVIGVLYLFLMTPVIIWQVSKTFDLLLISTIRTSRRVQALYGLSAGVPVQNVKSKVGEAEEQVVFRGTRLSDQRAYTEIVLFDEIEGEVHLYTKDGRVVFAALSSPSPLPLRGIHEQTWGRVLVCIITVVLVILLLLLRGSDGYRPIVWGLLAAFLAVGNASSPFLWLSWGSLLLSMLVSTLTVILWLAGLVGVIKHFIVLSSQQRIDAEREGEPTVRLSDRT
jgi:hypothetical protein